MPPPQLEPTTSCPVCLGQLETPIPQEPADGVTLQCKNCGTHPISREALEDLPAYVKKSDLQRARLAHAVARIADGELLTSALLQACSETSALPGAAARIDNLLLYAARTVPPGGAFDFDPKKMKATLGCENAEAAKWVRTEAEAQGLIRDTKMNGLVLTTRGWERHESLLRDGAGTRYAFMAMQFNDQERTSLFEQQLVPAVQSAGFELRTVAGDHQTAGSIDDRIRVEIRRSRFLVCDLTHGNRGAYWEAGFAEGIGRPVFYICREDVLSQPAHPSHPHFDTRQQLIVTWNPAEPTKGMQRLKNAIRATLPAEAEMND